MALPIKKQTPQRCISYDEVYSQFLDNVGQTSDRGVSRFVYELQSFGHTINDTLNTPVCKISARFKAGQVLKARTRRTTQQPLFARVADAFDGSTKEKVVEIKDELQETAKENRIPVPAVHLPYIGFVHSLTVKQLLCGIIAGSVASAAVVPFDVLQSKAIAGQGGRTAAEVLTTVYREDGLQSLMKGSVKFNIIKNGIERGLQFTVFEAVKRHQQRKRGRQRKVLPIPRAIPLSTAGGAAAGLFGTLISYPLQPAFARLLLQPEKYKSLFATLKTIVKHEGGIRELYRGITPTLISMVPSAAISFYVYQTLRDKYVWSEKGKCPQALASLIIGGVAGAVSTAVTFPLSESHKQIMYSALSPQAVHMGAARYDGTWQAMQGIVKREGVRGLYRGLTPSILQVVPMTAITFAVYEVAKRALIAQDEERPHEVKDASDLPPAQQSRIP